MGGSEADCRHAVRSLLEGLEELVIVGHGAVVVVSSKATAHLPEKLLRWGDRASRCTYYLSLFSSSLFPGFSLLRIGRFGTLPVGNDGTGKPCDFAYGC